MAAGVAIAYGLLAGVGGIIGYVKAGSRVSLLSGIISGIMLMIGGILIAREQQAGLTLSTIVTGILVVVFSLRLVKTRTLMPAGLMVVAGLGAIAVFLHALIA